MLENLSQREKVLAILVGSLLPLALVVMGLVWFFGQRSAREIRITSLRSQIETEQQRMTEALNANQRRIFYRAISLPSDFEEARNKYQQWLKKLLRDDVGISYRNVAMRTPAKLKFNGNVIGMTEIFTVSATTDLPKLVEFLTRFYDVDLLHRINSIKLVPKTTGRSGSEAGNRTGQITFSAEIEVLSLIDADSERDFVNKFRDQAVTAAEYRDTILKRNIFGPANNAPTLTVSKSSSYESGKKVRIPINAKDADDGQILTFKILESELDSPKIEQKKPTDKRVYLTAPGKPAGEYTFKVQVADNGSPPKTSVTEVKIRFKDKAVAKKKSPPPAKPKIKDARETRITGIVKDRTGTWQVWIHVRHKNKKHKLVEGESFELDDQEWEVISIEPDEVAFEVDGDKKTFGRNAAFDGSEKTASLN